MKEATIEEIKIDKNDSTKALILEKLFYDIKKRHLGFRQDILNEKEILHNNSLEQHEKLSMMQQHKSFHDQIKKHMGRKGYSIFKKLMVYIV